MITHRTITVALLAGLLAATPPAGAQQTSRERERVERERERAQEQREREQERREQERERAQERAEQARERAQELRERARERAQRDAERQRDREHDGDRGRQEADRVDTAVVLARGGVVDLALVAGEIIVTGWDRDEVRVRATSEHGALSFQATGSRATLRARPRSGRLGDTRYEVTVPHGTRLVLAGTSADLTARGTRGPVEVNTTSGDVSISGAASRVVFTSISGDIEISQVRGDVRGSTTSADVDLEGVVGDVEVETVSGDVALTDVSSKFVRLKSVSADLAYDGEIDPDGRYELGSHSGGVQVRLPANVGATLSVQTFSGSIESDFPIRLGQGTYPIGAGAKKFDFQVGEGGARIGLQSFSGDVRIERAGGQSRRGRERDEP